MEGSPERTGFSGMPSTSIPSTVTTIASGRQVAAKILKEGVTVWILAVVVKHDTDKDKYALMFVC